MSDSPSCCMTAWQNRIFGENGNDDRAIASFIVDKALLDGNLVQLESDEFVDVAFTKDKDEIKSWLHRANHQKIVVAHPETMEILAKFYIGNDDRWNVITGIEGSEYEVNLLDDATVSAEASREAGAR